jgi:DNA-binding response OmpR family regulator
MRILAVDDEEDTLQFLKDLLTQAGHRVVAVSKGLEAMAAAQVEPFDAILLDLMMPGTDGYEIARFLSDTWNTSDIPVIVISCRKDEESKSIA